MKTLAERLKSAREKKELTQQQLADKIKVRQSAIGNLESGARKTSRKVGLIARALGVNSLWLAEGLGERFDSAADDAANAEDQVEMAFANKNKAQESNIQNAPSIGEFLAKFSIIYEKITDDQRISLLAYGENFLIPSSKSRHVSKSGNKD